MHDAKQLVTICKPYIRVAYISASTPESSEESSTSESTLSGFSSSLEFSSRGFRLVVDVEGVLETAMGV